MPRKNRLPARPRVRQPQQPATIAGKTITITYSSPRVRGRAGQIFTKDGLISHDPHYPVWRAGANAATTLKTDADLTIGDLSVPAGTYTLFVDISAPANWVLIVNKKNGEWGLAYDSTQDLGKTKMMMSAPPSLVEDLTYTITDNKRRQRHADAGLGERERLGAHSGALRAGRPVTCGIRQGRRASL